MKLFKIFHKIEKVEGPKKVLHNRDWLESQMHKAEEDCAMYDKQYKAASNRFVQLAKQQFDVKEFQALQLELYGIMCQWKAAHKMYWDLKEMLD